MRKKSNKSLSGHIKSRFNINRDDRTPISSRTQPHHHQKDTLLIQSLEKSLTNTKLPSNLQKGFDDYGLTSKTNQNCHMPSNTYKKLVENQSQVSFPNKIKVTQMKLQKNQRTKLSKRNTSESKETKKRSIRRTEPVRSECSPQMHMSDNFQLKRSVMMSKQISRLNKDLIKYQRQYENSQKQISAYKQKVYESSKNLELTRQLYQQRIKQMEKQLELHQSYKMGHVYSYKQFPKDFIPIEIIAEISWELSHESNESSTGSQVCELSLNSH